MSEDKRGESKAGDAKLAKKDAGKASKPKKPNIIQRIPRYLREMRSELKKVVWPSRKQLINNSWIVLVAVVSVGAVVSGLDYVFLQLVNIVIGMAR